MYRQSLSRYSNNMKTCKQKMLMFSLIDTGLNLHNGLLLIHLSNFRQFLSSFINYSGITSVIRPVTAETQRTLHPLLVSFALLLLKHNVRSTHY